jgi:hypothetical protein
MSNPIGRVTRLPPAAGAKQGRAEHRSGPDGVGGKAPYCAQSKGSALRTRGARSHIKIKHWLIQQPA